MCAWAQRKGSPCLQFHEGRHWRSDSNTSNKPALNLADRGKTREMRDGSWWPPSADRWREKGEKEVGSGSGFYLHISAPQSPRWEWTSPGLAGTQRCSPPPIPPHPLLPQPSRSAGRRGTLSQTPRACVRPLGGRGPRKNGRRKSGPRSRPGTGTKPTNQ